jgi:HEAT repeat protein
LAAAWRPEVPATPLPPPSYTDHAGPDPQGIIGVILGSIALAGSFFTVCLGCLPSVIIIPLAVASLILGLFSRGRFRLAAVTVSLLALVVHLVIFAILTLSVSTITNAEKERAAKLKDPSAPPGKLAPAEKGPAEVKPPIDPEEARRKEIGRLAAALDSPSADVRYRALQDLASIGPAAQEQEAAILPCLQDRVPGVRKQALDTVARTGCKRPNIERELHKALENKDARIRLDAIDFLKHLRMDLEPTIPVLIASLRDGRLRARAVSLLGEVGKKAVPSLVKVLRDRDEAVKVAALQALRASKAEAREAIPELMLLLGDPRVRSQASLTLGSIGKEAMPALLKALDNEDDDYTRVGAAMTLGHLGEDAEAAVPRLEVLARRDPSLKVRETAATALRRIRK